MKAYFVGSSGRGLPCGGIIPPRNLRMTFSHVSAPSTGWSTSILSSISPAVRSLWLWQVTQYVSSSSRCGLAPPACCGPACILPEPVQNTAPAATVAAHTYLAALRIRQQLYQLTARRDL